MSEWGGTGGRDKEGLRGGGREKEGNMTVRWFPNLIHTHTHTHTHTHPTPTAWSPGTDNPPPTVLWKQAHPTLSLWAQHSSHLQHKLLRTKTLVAVILVWCVIHVCVHLVVATPLTHIHTYQNFPKHSEVMALPDL